MIILFFDAFVIGEIGAAVVVIVW